MNEKKKISIKKCILSINPLLHIGHYSVRLAKISILK